VTLTVICAYQGLCFAPLATLESGLVFRCDHWYHCSSQPMVSCGLVVSVPVVTVKRSPEAFRLGVYLAKLVGKKVRRHGIAQDSEYCVSLALLTEPGLPLYQSLASGPTNQHRAREPVQRSFAWRQYLKHMQRSGPRGAEYLAENLTHVTVATCNPDPRHIPRLSRPTIDLVPSPPHCPDSSKCCPEEPRPCGNQARTPTADRGTGRIAERPGIGRKRSDTLQREPR